MRNREKGFTLIELLVIIVILSIVIMMSTPRFSTTYNSMKIRSEAWKLGGYLRFISNKAVQNKKTYEVFLAGKNLLETYGLDDAQFLRHSIDTSIDLELEPDTITFYPSGMMSPFGIILQSSSGEAYEIMAEEHNSRFHITHLDTNNQP